MFVTAQVISLSAKLVATETLPAQSDPDPFLELFPRQTRNSFYRKWGKRAFDFCASLVALILLSPVFLLIAILVKLSSAGPVLFRQKRVGRDAQIFRILKFRSIMIDDDQQGLEITAAGDERVTPIGKFLRKSELDTLPQLWNVFKGEMSLVGPRPELPSYVAQYTFEQLRVLSVWPGITDLASIHYRHEEKPLETSADSDEFYRNVILPHKLALNLEYVDQMSFALDLRLVLRTLCSLT
jgi:lipopolysaccharide/colanic/teichoic acid biosynthesis glycosyltransferase